MTRLRAPLTLVLLSATLLAGCTKDNPLAASTIDQQSRFDGYSWPEPVAIGPAGLLAGHPLASADVRPLFVQQTLPMAAVTPLPPFDALVTRSPALAAPAPHVLVTTTLDQILRSVDGGANWTIATEFESLMSPQLTDRFESQGSSLWYDATTARSYALQYGLDGCQLIATSDDEGASWTAVTTNDWPASCTDAQGVADPVLGVQLTFFPRIFSGAARGPLAPLASGEPNVYVCEGMDSLDPKCATSWDGGSTFPYQSLPYQTEVANVEPACYHVSPGAPAVLPDGTIVLPLGKREPGLYNPRYGLLASLGEECLLPPQVAISQDSGLTWTVRTFPNATHLQIEAVPAAAVDADGQVYIAYRSQDALGQEQTYVLHSSDLFATWSEPMRASLPEHTVTSHPALVAGAAGNVAVSYLASRTPQESAQTRGTVSVQTEWHLVVATSTDAAADAPTYFVQQATPNEDPVAFGCLNEYFCVVDLGPYASMVADSEGRYYVSVIDACDPRNGCTADTQGGFEAAERQVTLLTLDAGTGILGTLLPSLGLRPPPPVGPATET